MSTEAEKFAPHQAPRRSGASGPGLALAQSGEDDDTDYDNDDTPSGNIWRPGAEPGQPPTASPGGRAVSPLPAAKRRPERSAGSRRLSPSLIFRTGITAPGADP